MVSQTMLNSHTDAFSALQFSSNHFPLAVMERTAQFWLGPPSGCWVISVSQFLKRTLEPDWSTQWPSVTMSLMPSQMCSSGPMLWRTQLQSWSFSSPVRGVLRVPPLAMQSSLAAWKDCFTRLARKHFLWIFVPFRQTDREGIMRKWFKSPGSVSALHLQKAV